MIFYRKQGKGAAQSFMRAATLLMESCCPLDLYSTLYRRNSYFLNSLHYPDSILNAFTHTFSSGLKSCFTPNISFLLCFSLNSQSFIILLPSFSTAGLFFMVLRLVILPLYCFISELLSRIRQLAYHRDMIY